MNRLKECREKAGYSQKFVAITVGVTPPQVCKWEAGVTQPSKKSLQILADLYSVTIDYLMGRAESEAAPAYSTDEAELLAIYRQLTAAGKSALMAAAEGMLAQPGLRQAGSIASEG